VRKEESVAEEIVEKGRRKKNWLRRIVEKTSDILLF